MKNIVQALSCLSVMNTNLVPLKRHNDAKRAVCNMEGSVNTFHCNRRVINCETLLTLLQHDVNIKQKSAFMLKGN